jgi:type IV pilus assembly protein PilV
MSGGVLRRRRVTPLAREPRRRACGAFLVEALVALVVLSLGMLGLAVVITEALRESGNAQWRAEAFDVASATLARISAEDPGTLAARYDASASGPGYAELLAAAMRLPGVDAASNAPSVAFDDVAPANRRVAVIVRWQPPAERAAHRVSVATVLPNR